MDPLFIPTLVPTFHGPRRSRARSGPIRSAKRQFLPRCFPLRYRTAYARPPDRLRFSRAPSLTLADFASQPSATESNGVAVAQPTLAQRARTVVHVCRTGTLCTKSVRHGGVPFGSHVDYVLDARGRPVFLLAKTAEHTMNLQGEKRCSLFCQSKDSAGQGGSRATLVGEVERMSSERLGEEERELVEDVKDLYIWTHPHAEELLQYPDLFEFYRMKLEDVFFVGGYGVGATYVDAKEFSETEADPLAFDAPGIVNEFNESRKEELMMVCRVFLDIEENIKSASMVALDHLGFDVRVLLEHGSTREYRIAFREKVQNEFDVSSALVKALQEAWEKENGFESDWADEERRPVGQYFAFDKKSLQHNGQ